MQIVISPLRERLEDIMLLLEHYISRPCLKENQPIKNKTKELLAAHTWHGNVRELQNMIGRAYYLSITNIIHEDDLPDYMTQQKNKISNKIIKLQYKDAKKCAISEFESEYLTYHLKENKGNISKTAEICGIDGRTLHKLITKYNIIYKDEG